MSLYEPVPPSSVYGVRLAAEDRQRIEAAAKRAKLPLADWTRRALRERACVEAGMPLVHPEADAHRVAFLQDKQRSEALALAAVTGSTIGELVELACAIRKIGPHTNLIARTAVHLARARHTAQRFPSETTARTAHQLEERLGRLVELARSARESAAPAGTPNQFVAGAPTVSNHNPAHQSGDNTPDLRDMLSTM